MTKTKGFSVLVALLVFALISGVASAGSAQSMVDAHSYGQYAATQVSVYSDGNYAGGNAYAGSFDACHNAAAQVMTTAGDSYKGVYSGAQAYGTSTYTQSGSYVSPYYAETMGHAETYGPGTASTQADASGIYAESSSSAYADETGAVSDSTAYTGEAYV